MQSTELSTEQVLASTNMYLIPNFQRHYEWDESTAVTLLDDIFWLLDPANEHTTEPHFIGSIIFQQVGEVTFPMRQLAVIDGQQRLTTIKLILRALLDFVKTDVTVNRIASSLIDKRYSRQSDAPKRYRFVPVQSDREAIWDIIDPDTPDSVLEETLKSSAKAAKNYNAIHNRIEKWVSNPNHNLEGTEENLVDGVLWLRIVVITLNSNEDPHRIFHTMNNRGKDLLGSDSVRNQLFMGLGGVDGATGMDFSNKMYDNYFLNLEKNAMSARQLVKDKDEKKDKDFLGEFLVQYFLAVRKTDKIHNSTSRYMKNEKTFVSVAKVQDAYEYGLAALEEQAYRNRRPDASDDEVKQATHAQKMEVLLQDMLDMSVVYRQINERLGQLDQFYRMPEYEQLYVSILAEDMLGASSAYPVVMFLLSRMEDEHTKDSYTEKTVTEVLKCMQTYVVRRLARGKSAKSSIDTQVAVTVFLSVLDAWDGQDTDMLLDDLWARLAKQGGSQGKRELPGDPVFEDVLRTGDMYTKSGPKRLLKFMLYFKDMQQSRELPPITQQLTIEHVMPQNFNGAWKDYLGIDQQEHDKYQHVIGNLCLLNGQGNSGVQDHLFVGKADSYRQSAFPWTRAAAQCQRWDVDAIKRRTEECVEFAMSQWRLPEKYRGFAKLETAFVTKKKLSEYEPSGVSGITPVFIDYNGTITDSDISWRVVTKFVVDVAAQKLGTKFPAVAEELAAAYPRWIKEKTEEWEETPEQRSLGDTYYIVTRDNAPTTLSRIFDLLKVFDRELGETLENQIVVGTKENKNGMAKK